MTSVFTYDLNNQLTEIQHADGVTDLFRVQHGYDLVGNRLWTKDLVRSTRDELYEYDNLNRLRGFQRGTLNANRDDLNLTLVHDVLPSEQAFALDLNGNWDQFDQTVGVPAVTVNEYRTVNDVNEYITLTIDETDYTPTHDDNGNLTYDPRAENIGDAAGTPSGQEYDYDEENRLVEVRRASDDAVLQEYIYDALGRRIATYNYVDTGVAGTSNPCGDDPNDPNDPDWPVATRHIYAGLAVLEEHIWCERSGEGAGWELAREFLWGNRFPEPVTMIDHTGAK